MARRDAPERTRLASPARGPRRAILDHPDRAYGDLYSARTGAEYAALELELDALRILRNDRAVADAASGALRELSQRGDGYHRIPFSDALIAAAAAEHGAVAVVHRDAHFDRLAEVLAFSSILLPGG